MCIWRNSFGTSPSFYNSRQRRGPSTAIMNTASIQVLRSLRHAYSPTRQVLHYGTMRSGPHKVNVATFHIGSLMLTRLRNLPSRGLTGDQQGEGQISRPFGGSPRSCYTIRASEHGSWYNRDASIRETDTTAGMLCLDTGLKIKPKWKGVCDIQIVGG